MKKIFLLTLCVLLFACTTEQVPEKQKDVPTQSVDLDRNKLEMVVGDVVELRATVNPKDATNQNVEWDSSDLTVVAVRDGEVKAIGPGRAIVTVKTEDGGYTSECVVYVSPDVQTQKKGPMTLSLRYVSATSAVLSGFIDVEQLSGYDVSGGGVGFIYAPSGTELDIDNAEKVAISSVDSENAFKKTLTGLKYDTRYVYTIFLRKDGIVQYGETQYFDTKEVTISVDQVSVTNTKATLKGMVVRLPEDSDVKVGLMYSSSNTFPSGSKSYTIAPYSDGSYTQEITGLTVGATYYFRTYLYYEGKYEYGETKEFTTNAINVNLAVSSKTATTVTFSGKMDPVSEKSSVAIGVYVNTSETVNSSNYKKMMRAFDSDIAEDGTFSVTITGLSMATQYYYTPFVYSNSTYSYGEIKDFSTENIQVTLSSKSSDITATTAKITGTITGMSDVDNSEIDAIGVAYSTSSSNLKTDNSTKVSATSISANTFAITLEPLTNNCKYYYCYYVKQNGKYTYGETMELTTKNVTPSVSLVESSLTATTAKIKGTVPSLSSNDKSRLEFGVAYSTSSSSLKSSSSTKKSATLSSNGTFNVSLENLTTYTKYYYCSYVKQNGSYTYGEAKEFNTVNVIPTVGVVESSITATTATMSGTVSNLSDSDKSCLEFGVAYSTSSSSLKSSSSVKESVTLLSDGTFSVSLENLNINTKYYYCSYRKQNDRYTYGEAKEFNTVNVIPTVSVVESSITATTATMSGTVSNLSDSDRSCLEFGVAYSISSSSLKSSSSVKESVTLLSDGTFSVSLENLNINTKYYYCPYVKQNGSYTYGEAKEFNTINVIHTVSVVESSITARKATMSGMVSNLSDPDKYCLEFGVAYSTSSSGLKSSSSVKESVTLLSDGTFSVSLENLNINTKYYYCSYVKHNGNYTYGEAKEFTTYPYNVPVDLNVASATDLSSSASANCYIVSEAGLYKFKPVKGNRSTSVGAVASAAILWETFGTNTAPELSDLISAFCYKDGYIAFQTSDTFKEGNAVIAAKDANGTILWSWHIWFTDQPQEQVYYNNAGTMMDRNLGATSATPGDIGALGLLYQWGRKDPFLGSSSIRSSSLAKSTITWPSEVSSTSSQGTIEYATANPTTFIAYNRNNRDWYYTGSSSTDNTRWSTSAKTKSIYDPCPSGWRVPDGGSNGVWSKANGSSWLFDHTYNSTNGGMNFSGKFGNDQTIWYPATGSRDYDDGSLISVGNYGGYWSASPDDNDAYGLGFNTSEPVYPSSSGLRAAGRSVRCIKE